MDEAFNLDYLCSEICKLATEYREEKDNILIYIDSENIYNQPVISDSDIRILIEKLSNIEGTGVEHAIGIDLSEFTSEGDGNE